MFCVSFYMTDKMFDKSIIINVLKNYEFYFQTKHST